MSILFVQERNGLVYVYGENNIQLFSRCGELYGYTSSSVTIKSGNLLHIYNEKGTQIGSRPC